MVGLDLATVTGVAIFDTDADPSAIITGHWRLGGDSESDLWNRAEAGEQVVLLRDQVARLFGRDKRTAIDLVIIEAKAALPIGGAGAGGWGSTSELHGAVTSHLRTMKIPFATIAPSTWRSAVFAKGFVPEIKTEKDGKKTKLWKKAAVDHCIGLGIQLPANKNQGREDAAEAALMVQAWVHATPHGPIGVEALKRCKAARNERKAA